MKPKRTLKNASLVLITSLTLTFTSCGQPVTNSSSIKDLIHANQQAKVEAAAAAARKGSGNATGALAPAPVTATPPVAVGPVPTPATGPMATGAGPVTAPVPSKAPSVHALVAGTCLISGVNTPGFWDNRSWTALKGAPAEAVVVGVSVSGSEVSIGTTLGYWKNEVWTAFDLKAPPKTFLWGQQFAGKDLITWGSLGFSVNSVYTEFKKLLPVTGSDGRPLPILPNLLDAFVDGTDYHFIVSNGFRVFYLKNGQLTKTIELPKSLDLRPLAYIEKTESGIVHHFLALKVNDLTLASKSVYYLRESVPSTIDVDTEEANFEIAGFRIVNGKLNAVGKRNRDPKLAKTANEQLVWKDGVSSKINFKNEFVPLATGGSYQSFDGSMYYFALGNHSTGAAGGGVGINAEFSEVTCPKGGDATLAGLAILEH